MGVRLLEQVRYGDNTLILKSLKSRPPRANCRIFAHHKTGGYSMDMDPFIFSNLLTLAPCQWGSDPDCHAYTLIIILQYHGQVYGVT